jgi:hypothetical protein
MPIRQASLETRERKEEEGRRKGERKGEKG